MAFLFNENIFCNDLSKTFDIFGKEITRKVEYLFL